MNANVYLLYLATLSVVSISPGPAVMFAMSQATRHGLRRAFLGIAGLLLAHVVFFGCIGSGLVALLTTSTVAFTLLKVVGAAYLLYLGVRFFVHSFRSQTTAEPDKVQAAPLSSRSGLLPLLQGFAIQVTNPKALLFFSALLPQFIQAQQPLHWQLGILFAITVCVDAIVFSTYAVFAERSAVWLRSTGVGIWMERGFGIMMLGFGVSLVAR
jgi:homoserine/homoserine lactone efflux protein